ncbi:hypothetical protein RRG08_044954 [Elysia crispata]|uniref:Uncharacterized protein n=1 Tax=Elysia crispata TaxID=231223 RepID=A0AAE0ZTY3_9GAST|nr:hypothetical protein RRG08_044954 [Elysia crispata]
MSVCLQILDLITSSPFCSSSYYFADAIHHSAPSHFVARDELLTKAVGGQFEILSCPSSALIKVQDMIRTSYWTFCLSGHFIRL